MSQIILIPKLKRIFNQQTLLDTPELKIKKKFVYAITGPSGSGKTLFLNQLFFEEEILKPEQGQFYMLQEPGAGLTPHLKIKDHMNDLPALKNLSVENTPQELSPFTDRYPSSISGGERQRVMASLILSQNLELLACDEPAANLSPKHAESLFISIIEARKKTPFTFLFVSHQWQWIEDYADYILYFQHGQITHFIEKNDLQTIPAYITWKNLAAHPTPSSIKPIPERNIETSTDTPFVYSSNHSPGGKLDPQAPGTLLSIIDMNLTLGGKRLFQDFSWSTPEGDWWWVLGANGSGKTTFGKILAGLFQPDCGSFFWKGVEFPFLLGNRIKQNRPKIQYVFQQGLHLFNPKLRMKYQLNPFFSGKEEKLMNLMDAAGLPTRLLKQFPQTLSLGEKQRFNLIRALGSDPELLIADEILASLDILSQIQMIQFLKRIQADQGTTILVMTHDIHVQNLNEAKILTLGS